MSPELATIATERLDGQLLVSLSGDIDLSNVEPLQHRIEHAVQGTSNIVVDLSAVGYIDSQGLRLLSRLVRRCSREGSRLRLVAPPGTFARGVLELARIGEDVEMVDTLEAATGLSPGT